MDLHKPKPWRGFREFLKEYLIIVVGVLTALAGEQVVEWSHQQHELREARDALHEEVVFGTRAIRIAALEYRCQLGEVQLADAWARGGPKPPAMTGVIFPYPDDAVWESLKSGVVTRMPLKERLAYLDYYAQAANYRALYGPMRERSITLGSYLAWDKPTPAEARSLQRDIFQWRVYLRVLLGNTPALLQSARKLGVEPQPLTPRERAIVQSECAVAGVPFDDKGP
jgi:hypothetical protein